jgi:hypothetical protein
VLVNKCGQRSFECALKPATGRLSAGSEQARHNVTSACGGIYIILLIASLLPLFFLAPANLEHEILVTTGLAPAERGDNDVGISL